MHLHIDIETFSSVDIRKSGLYKYCESPDFEILLIAYVFYYKEIKVVDLANGEKLPFELTEAFNNEAVLIHAHNATFERQAFKQIGYDIPISRWRCSMAHSAYCGLPLSLDQVSKALKLGDKAKSASGKALIKYFSVPCKPTKVNGGRRRNYPHHDPEKWEQFKQYVIQDVEAEREVKKRLRRYPLPDQEQKIYELDQRINDKGITIDRKQAKGAVKISGDLKESIIAKQKELTGLDNPNSVPQLKKWLEKTTKKEITSLDKEAVISLLESEKDTAVREVLKGRQQLGKSSIQKYSAMLSSICVDGRGRGYFQYYGAMHTGRWAGRLVQLQNLTKSKIPNLETAKKLISAGNMDYLDMVFGNPSSLLSQLIRPTFIASTGHMLIAADYSAIEARITAWLAEEVWRLDVFKTHGKIYEASASNMFGIPIEKITKDSPLRQKGKIAELALGFQGGVGAMAKMGAEKMGLSKSEMSDVVTRWREANPNIVKLWKGFENAAKKAITTGRGILYQRILFNYDGYSLTVKLPSGRCLFYNEPTIRPKIIRTSNGDSFTVEAIKYKGVESGVYTWLHTYGGSLTENIVQGIARDLLAEAMLRLDKKGYKIVMHVHDEVVCEIEDFFPEARLKKMCKIMCESVYWAPGLPLNAEGFVSKFYKKD